MVQRTSVGLDVHARSVAAAGIDGQTGDEHAPAVAAARGHGGNRQVVDRCAVWVCVVAGVATVTGRRFTLPT